MRSRATPGCAAISGRARRVRALGCLAAALVGVSWASRQAPVESPDGLVTVEVAVERTRGGLVPGLGREDFEVLSDFEPCPIDFFSASGPLAVVLLVDTSPSMPVPLDALREAVERDVISNLNPADRVRVGTVGGPLLPPRFTADRRELADAIGALLGPDRAPAFGPSPIWDAADEAIAALADEGGRRAVVLVTDGRSTGNVHSRTDVAVRAMAAGVVVSAVGLSQVWAWGAGIPYDWRGLGTTIVRSDPGRGLRELADVTGGSYAAPWPVSSAAETRLALARTVGDLHLMYTLGFTPPDFDGRVHGLEVRVRDPGMIVRSRRAYIAKARRGPGVRLDSNASTFWNLITGLGLRPAPFTGRTKPQRAIVRSAREGLPSARPLGALGDSGCRFVSEG